MDRSERAIFTNMCMIYKGDKILVQDRKKEDWPGLTFPGGHVERAESFVESTIREVREETGLLVEELKFCGVKDFMTLAGERYLVFLFKTDKFQGELKSSSEGEVFWIDRDQLESYDLAEDFLDMVRIFEDDDLSELYYGDRKKLL